MHMIRQWMIENVNIVDFEEIISPNVPQSRPIESFWAK